MDHTLHLLKGEQDLIMEGLNNGYMKKFQHDNILLIVQNIPPIMDKVLTSFLVVVHL